MKTTQSTNNMLTPNGAAEQLGTFETTLQGAATTWFQKQGASVQAECGYCLREPYLWHHNIILPEVTQLIQRTEVSWKARNPGSSCLHGFLHHGLSSQAMGFNLLGPLVTRGDMGPLKAVLTAMHAKWPSAPLTPHFEYSDRRVFAERGGMPTCLDFALVGRTTGLYMEVKLTERGFGGCSFCKDGRCTGQNPCTQGGIEACPLTLKGRIYWQRMAEFGLSEAALIDGETCPFVNHYQFFRELMFAMAKGGVYILLFDERNPMFVQRDSQGTLVGGICKRLSEVLPRHIWSRVGGITVQSLVRAIEASGRHEDWIHAFKEKYALNTTDKLAARGGTVGSSSWQL